jgi:succinate dehydrogenase / fumarate reductase cytochrome b subunit
MGAFLKYFQSSIGKKQIVAATGLLLVLFVIGHLAGNLLIYLGPKAFNGYADKLARLRPGLYLVEIALAVVFFIHMWLTAIIVVENRLARPVGYAVVKPVGKRSLATRLMPFSGSVIIVFVISHLFDFTFMDHGGPLSVLDDGSSYGLYGVVYNTFAGLPDSLFYIVAMMALGLHLSHGIQSFAQTFGLSRPGSMPAVRWFSNGLGILIAAGYSSIPIYILAQSLR